MTSEQHKWVATSSGATIRVKKQLTRDERHKLSRARANKKYRETSYGQVAIRRAQLKYLWTENGRKAKARANRKYQTSPKGKIITAECIRRFHERQNASAS